MRFAVVGAWNTAFGVALFTFMYLLGGDALGYIGVLTIAQAVAVVQAHATQRLFVWRSRLGYARELVRFSSVYALTYLLNVVLLAAAVDVAHAPALYSQWAIGGLLLIATYFVQRGWTFRAPASTTSGNEESGASHLGEETPVPVDGSS